MYIYIIYIITGIGGPVGSKVKFDEVNSSASLSLLLAYNNVHYLDEVTVHSTSIWNVCT